MFAEWAHIVSIEHNKVFIIEIKGIAQMYQEILESLSAKELEENSQLGQLIRLGAKELKVCVARINCLDRFNREKKINLNSRSEKFDAHKTNEINKDL